MKKIVQIVAGVMLISLLLAACQAAGSGTEPYLITGSFDYTSPFISLIAEEHMVAMVDMYPCVTRDLEWEIPVDSQTLGYLDVDEEAMSGTYRLVLPSRPLSTLTDLDNDGETDTGVQIFTIAWWPNIYGSPYSTGDDRSRGCQSFYATLRTDPENDDEIIGGQMIVWAPDRNQQFPTGFGDDGLLFTEDDPVAGIPAGYSIVDLDQTPFHIYKQAEVELNLYEPSDFALKDFSALSYAEAFDGMFEIVRAEYAFNGIEGKEPDWDALYAELQPRVAAAEAAGDEQAYFFALQDFVWAFKDGHVGIGENETSYFVEAFQADTAAGYGFAIRETDDGRFLVVFLTPGGPAEDAGMQLGAELTAFNGQTVEAALQAVRPWSLPFSTDWELRYQQARYLLRSATVGSEIEVTFTNPDEDPQTATLAAVSENDSFSYTSIYRDAPTSLLPVEFEILDSGVGYVRINTNIDDLALIVKLFERALQAFTEAEVPGIIIDMRFNGGGSPLGLAGFLTDQEIPMGQAYYYSAETGQFEPEGLLDRVLPNENQYTFDKIAVMVGPACASACEDEAYGFSQVPGAIVVGEFPSNGMMGEVGRGQFLMPGNFSMQVPTGRYLTEDGSLFLEGTGVVPTLYVPRNETTFFASGDVALQFAERAVLLPLGAGITPAAPPTVGSSEDAGSHLLSSDWLNDLAREEYEGTQLMVPGTFTYTVALQESENLIWAEYWCTTTQEILDQNFLHIGFTFSIEGTPVAADSISVDDLETSTGMFCRIHSVYLTDWAAGEHHLTSTMTFSQAINDGVDDYPAGTWTNQFTVYVKP